jgi:ABC-type branched-subunit amino acid transport system substrate-binding protein
MPAARTARRWSAVIVLAALLAACTTERSDKPSSGTTPSGSTGLTASARGVTADTINVGFSYIDLETLAESGIIKISHGPYEEIISALVDDVNEAGGINGRKLELFTAKYSPIGNTEQLAACTKLTEDDAVFVVLNGLLNDNNLCITQQHQTALIGGGTTALTPANLARARAPWASYSATSERSIDALVEALDENGDLDGHVIGVYAAQVANRPLIDAAVKALTDAGYPPAETALNDAPDNDTQAATAQDKVIAQRFMNADVDTVIDVGQYIPGASFDSVGYHPSLYTLETGNIAAGAFTNPFGKFPVVAGLGGSGDPDAAIQSPAFQKCADAWKQASGKEIQGLLEEDLAGKSSGNVAMQIACTTLQIFVEGAKAAGPNLTNETLQQGIESIGSIQFANGTQGSFGPDKLDGQDSFQLQKFDPNWKEGEGKPQFISVGEPVTLGG